MTVNRIMIGGSWDLAASGNTATFKLLKYSEGAFVPVFDTSDGDQVDMLLQ